MRRLPRWPFQTWAARRGCRTWVRGAAAQIGATYGHVLGDSIDRARTALESFGRGVATEEDAESELL